MFNKKLIREKDELIIKQYETISKQAKEIYDCLKLIKDQNKQLKKLKRAGVGDE